MRYNKGRVNAIIDDIIEAAAAVSPEFQYDPRFTSKLSEIKESHFLVDQRTSALPEYSSNVVHDLTINYLSYRDIMAKYKCSFATLMTLLEDVAESDERVKYEMEQRSRV